MSRRACGMALLAGVWPLPLSAVGMSSLRNCLQNIKYGEPQLGHLYLYFALFATRISNLCPFGHWASPLKTHHFNMPTYNSLKDKCTPTFSYAKCRSRHLGVPCTNMEKHPTYLTPVVIWLGSIHQSPQAPSHSGCCAMRKECPP